MSTLIEFSEKERAYHAYQARQNFLRQQKSIAKRIETLTAEASRERMEKERARAAEERERVEKERAQAAEERERGQKEAALAEIDRLRALLKDSPTG
jgi:hypothetical protein